MQSPFSRSQRSLVYARAKNEGSERAFGTQLDVYETGYEFIAHSTRPAPAADTAGFRVLVGGDQCEQPYSASIFNISALSFGSLSANAILALNKGARIGGFAHDTGEGSISPYHLRHGGDLIWELGSGYFGCRTADGNFDPDRLRRESRFGPGQDGRNQAQPGREARPWRNPPGGQGDARNLPHPRRPHGPGLHLPGPAQGIFDPDRDDALRRAPAGAFGRQAGRVQIVHRPPVGVHGDRQGDAGNWRSSPTSSSSTAPRGHRRIAAGVHDHIGVPLREGLLFVHNTLVGASFATASGSAPRGRS